jgi:hypothetical protein
MFRLLGFLLGSTVAIATILFILGLPQFHFDDAELDSPITEAAAEDIQAVQRELTPLPEQDAQETTEDTGEETEEAVVTPVVWQVVAEQELPVVLTESEMRWYSFWSPFRSEIAANGFVSQLEDVTGLDYRIVKVKVGVYEVAFAYIDDTERTNKLEQISAATGLDLTES